MGFFFIDSSFWNFNGFDVAPTVPRICYLYARVAIYLRNQNIHIETIQLLEKWTLKMGRDRWGAPNKEGRYNEGALHVFRHLPFNMLTHGTSTWYGHHNNNNNNNNLCFHFLANNHGGGFGSNKTILTTPLWLVPSQEYIGYWFVLFFLYKSSFFI